MFDIRKTIHTCIHAEKKKQTMDGWGTSLCWWANVVGAWKNEDKINEIADLIFSEEKGLGINIVRYNIGGGDNPPNYKNLRYGANMPCFLTEQGGWNWEADAGQRNILLKAKERGVTHFEAFSNAPPFWMTKNRSSAGADDRRNNLHESRYAEFADFLCEVIRHFKEEWGVVFESVAPFNEPISCWWYKYNNQEGCFFDIDRQILIMELLRERLDAYGIKDTAVTGPECWSVFESVYAYGGYIDAIRGQMLHINTHGYSGDRNSRQFLGTIADREGKKIWMSEAGFGGTENSHNHNDISGALALAKSIREDLMEMNASAWIYWQVVENELLNHNHGMIHANFTGTQDYWITKQYYAFANFCKFIREGMTILDVDAENMVAAYDEKKRKMVIVLFNDSLERMHCSIDLTEFLSVGEYALVYRTSVNDNLKELEKVYISDEVLEAELIAKSICTYIINNIE